ncbi:MAG TPA: uroporphyrinogen-III synthase [Chroococcales cyanobacterium]
MNDAGAQALPLSGFSILITRSSDQSSSLSEKFHVLGATTIAVPTIQIAPPLSYTALDQALTHLDRYDWLIFASTNAVASFVERACQSGLTSNLTGPKLAAIGRSTAQKLGEYGLKADFVPSRFVAESFVEEFPGYPNLDGVRILWPRTSAGRALIVDKLSAARAQIELIETYRTLAPAEMEGAALAVKAALERSLVDAITIASSLSAKNLALLLGQAYLIETTRAEELASALKEILAPVAIVAIGPETAATAREWLGKCDGQAEQYTMAGLVEATTAVLTRRTPRQPAKQH